MGFRHRVDTVTEGIPIRANISLQKKVLSFTE